MRLWSRGMVALVAAIRERRPREQAALLVLVALIGSGCAGRDHDGHHQHRFQDAERWARVFDDPARDAWQKPDDVVRALAPAPDALVADIGAGTGYFAVRLARAVPRGHVYGADTEPDMVRYLAERGRREGLANLTSVEAAPHDPRLPRAVDLVLMVNTYHHVAERPAYFGRLRPLLSPGGRVAIVDFLPDAPAGPPRQARIPAAVVKEEMGRAGYGLVTEHTFLPYQYLLIFAPR
ncbi:MAG: class I SAM-dependent methyltransferase [Candidatus Rokubacteria bacterium]|nr:class I SAM-dependent methyltransferase [Candidatus Rokubacteria bacterium]